MTLKIISKVIKELNDENIEYCHWKSNAHLDLSMRGKTDLDIMVSPKDEFRFKEIIEKNGFKRRTSSSDRYYAGTESFFGFDDGFGELVHIHLHYVLNIGRRHIKNYNLPLIEKIFASTTIDDDFGIKVISPEIELTLLILRNILKKGYYVYTVPWFYLSLSNFFPRNICHEIKFLLKKIDHDNFEKTIKGLFDRMSEISHQSEKSLSTKNHHDLSKTSGSLENLIKIILDQYKQYRKNKINVAEFYLKKFLLKKELKDFRRQKPSQVFCQYFTNKYIRSKLPKKISEEGTIIAMVGCDGCGKTTISKEIEKFLSGKFSVKHFYVGNQTSLLIKTCNSFIGILRTIRQMYPSITLAGKIEEFIDSLQILLRTKKLYLLVQKIKNFSKQGYVVVTDRWPIHSLSDSKDNDVLRYLGGPTIRSVYPSSNSLINNLSSKEEKYHSKIYLPDFTIILDIDSSTAISRKEDHRHIPETIKKKVEVMNSLKNLKPNVIVIDATKELKEVKNEVKKRLWEKL